MPIEQGGYNPESEHPTESQTTEGQEREKVAEFLREGFNKFKSRFSETKEAILDALGTIDIEAIVNEIAGLAMVALAVHWGNTTHGDSAIWIETMKGIGKEGLRRALFPRLIANGSRLRRMGY